MDCELIYVLDHEWQVPTCIFSVATFNRLTFYFFYFSVLVGFRPIILACIVSASQTKSRRSNSLLAQKWPCCKQI